MSEGILQVAVALAVIALLIGFSVLSAVIIRLVILMAA